MLAPNARARGSACSMAAAAPLEKSVGMRIRSIVAIEDRGCVRRAESFARRMSQPIGGADVFPKKATGDRQPATGNRQKVTALRVCL